MTITLDFENSLLHTVIENFPNTKLIGCYYHYKATLYREAQKLGYTKKKNIEATLDIINSNLSLIPFKIVENSEYATKLLKDLRRKYKNYSSFFDYYENYWYGFIDNGMLNYKNISKEIRTNNFLENYNGKLKLKLKGKKLLNWKEYIDLLIGEENFFKIKLINYETNNNNNMNNNNDRQKNITNINRNSVNKNTNINRWFKWHKSSCRIYSFSLLYHLILDNVLAEDQINHIQIKNIKEFSKYVKNFNQNDFNKGIWYFLENSKINFFMFNGPIVNYEVDDIIQPLFNIFNENDFFCIKYKKLFKCKKHLPLGTIENLKTKPLLSFSFEECKLKTINNIMYGKFSFNSISCPQCDYSNSSSNNLEKNGEIAFSEIILSKILIFEIVYDTYQDLVDNVKIYSDMFKDKIGIFGQDYKLKGIICMPSLHHFTLYIHDYI